MATLGELPPDELEGAIHLLLIGPSKVGKTHYIAELVKDGFTVLYVDNDNGKNTLRRKLQGDQAALNRVHYVETRNIWEFITAFFARTRFLWNETRDIIYSGPASSDDDKILEIYTKKIPFGVVLVFDSWTSICLQLLQDSAAKNNVSMEVFNDAGQSVYGDGSRRANTLLMNMQSHPGHIIVQAHQEQYEILEKGKGKMQDVAKQNQMIVKDNVTVPSSISRPHGFTMPKFFNEVGWMRVTATGKFVLDFAQKFDRVGGGSPMTEGDPNDTMRFSRIFVKPREVPGGWIRTIPASELKEEDARIAEERKAKAEAAKAAAAAKGISPAKPGLAAAGSLLRK